MLENTSAVQLLGGATLLVVLCYLYFLRPLSSSSLSRIPAAHPTVSVTSLWILYHRLVQRDTIVVHDAHARLGPIIRIAPNEISVNCVDEGIRTIYSGFKGGFERSPWYQNAFCNYGVMPMFAMPDRERHGKRKRMISNVYAKSVLLGSPAIRKLTDVIVEENLRARLRSDMQACGQQGVEFYDIFAAVTMDFVSGYVFGLGNGTNLLKDNRASRKFREEFKARQVYTFWPQECPRLMRFMTMIGLQRLLVPQWVAESNNEIEDWLTKSCEGAETTLREVGNDESSFRGKEETYPVVYAQLRNALVKDQGMQKESKGVMQGLLGREIASELLDHTAAGFDTSSIALTYLAWEISRPPNKVWQRILQKELLSLSAEEFRDPKVIDGLPILHAIMMETLRLHAPIPGQQPRTTPYPWHDSSPIILAGYEVPYGVRVQAQAWSLHRNPDVFPEPNVFEPRRWLSGVQGGEDLNAQDLPYFACVSAEQLKEMNRWFWAFSSGGRMCVGSNLAMMDMKATVASIWAIFETTLVSSDEAMRHNGGYLSEPLGDEKGNFCRLTLKEL